MTISDYINRKIPEYYDTMHLDGFTPQEILTALHKKMIQQYGSADQQTPDPCRLSSKIDHFLRLILTT